MKQCQWFGVWGGDPNATLPHVNVHNVSRASLFPQKGGPFRTPINVSIPLYEQTALIFAGKMEWLSEYYYFAKGVVVINDLRAIDKVESLSKERHHVYTYH